MSINRPTNEFEAPKTQPELDALINELHAQCDRGEFSGALAICQHLINCEKTRISGYRERAEIWQAMSEYDLSLHDLRQIIDSPANEPVDYYNFGILLLKKGEASDSVSAFTACIDLSDKHGGYYSSSCRFHRAAAYLRLGMRKEFYTDCREIKEGYRCYLPGFGAISIEDLAMQAESVFGRQE